MQKPMMVAAKDGVAAVAYAKHFYMFNGIGGTHAAESSAGTRYTGNLEKSFSDAAQAAVAKFGFDFQTKKVLSDNLTKRYEIGQITLRQKQELDAALATATSMQEFQLAMAQIVGAP
jgi:hypothetical protein